MSAAVCMQHTGWHKSNLALNSEYVDSSVKWFLHHTVRISVVLWSSGYINLARSAPVTKLQTIDHVYRPNLLISTVECECFYIYFGAELSHLMAWIVAVNSVLLAPQFTWKSSLQHRHMSIFTYQQLTHSIVGPVAQSVSRLCSGLDGPGTDPRGGGAARFSAPVQTGPGTHPASCTMGTGSFPGVKQTGRDADPSPLLSPRSKNRVELYLYSLQVSSWSVNRVKPTNLMHSIDKIMFIKIIPRCLDLY
jgi:hypothetical protein